MEPRKTTRPRIAAIDALRERQSRRWQRGARLNIQIEGSVAERFDRAVRTLGQYGSGYGTKADIVEAALDRFLGEVGY